MPDNHMDLLKKAIASKGQAQTARDLGYSDAAICQVVKDNYKGDTGRILRRVAEVYGTETTPCPVLGDITLGRCAEERKKPFSSASPLRLRLWKACRTCAPQTKDGGDS